MQKDADHFQDDSEIPPEVVRQILNYVADQGGVGSPFNRSLVQMYNNPDADDVGDGHASMIVADPEAIVDAIGGVMTPKVDKTTAICEVVDERCDLEQREIIVDADEDHEIGDIIRVGGTEVKVVAFAKQARSFTNRELGYVDEETFKEIVDQSIPDYYGINITGLDAEVIAQALNDLGVGDEFLEASTIEDFIDHNEDFWNKAVNSLIAILFMSGFSYALSNHSLERRLELSDNRRTVAGLRIRGFSGVDIAHIGLGRAVKSTAAALPAAYFATDVLATFADKGITGFNPEITADMGAAAIGALLVTEAAAAMRGGARVARQEPGRNI